MLLCVFIILLTGCATIAKQTKEAEIVLGIERIDEYAKLFAAKRVGLITNPTGINRFGKTSIDILNENVNLIALFSPEHGIRGSEREGANISNSIDKKTGLPVYSLYGNTKRPTKEMMEKIDMLCFDIQDVGARFYTYIYTMAYAMEAAFMYNKEFVVFDRPNPISGTVEGNILQKKFKSFVGYYPIVQRHGMTVGELAAMFNSEFGINCRLTVIPMQNWDRNKMFSDFHLMWIPTSPNIPKPKTALIYVGMGMFEGVNVSVGRGTTMPFEYIGAPYMDAELTAFELNKLKLSGVFFYPVYFTPSLSVYKNQNCQGVQIIITDEKLFQPIKTALFMFETFKNLYPKKFKINNYGSSRCGLNLLTGCDDITKNDFNALEFYKKVKHDTQIFKNKREKYLLYK
ncbi:MAG: hypothetical protein CR988_03435 [Treponema sp.]|nr:MAG: hypothetical protein CR988_03435 [Treponema sp.]